MPAHPPQPQPPLLDAAATGQVLDWRALVAALRVAAVELQDGGIRCPERLVLPLGPGGGVLLSMPAVAADLASHKLITVVPGNAARGLPVIQGQVSVLDAASGTTLLLLDGPTVTGRRTAAVSMLGLDLFCGGAGPRHVLMMGTGVQARHHAEALAALYPGSSLSVRGSSAAASDRFCQAHATLHPRMAADDGADGADVVLTCTSSRTPVYAEAARQSRVVVAVGAFQPTAAEIAAATVLGSQLYVDDPAGASHEAGDLLLAGVDWTTVSPLADAVRHGRTGDLPVLFKTVGCAAWDLAAARVAMASQSC